MSTMLDSLSPELHTGLDPLHESNSGESQVRAERVSDI